MNFMGLLCVAVNVEDPGRTIFCRVHQDFVGHCIGEEGAIAGAKCVGNCSERGVEIGVSHATAFAGAAKMAWAAAVNRAGEICGARRYRCSAEFRFDAFAEHRFLTSERHGRLKLAVGKVFETFFRTADANVFFDEVVIGRDVFVTERPIFIEAVVGSGFEIEIAEAKRDTSPNIGATAGHADAAHPKKWMILWRGIGLFEIVRKPIGSVLVANTKNGLDGAGLANCFQCHVAILQSEGGLVLREIGVGLRTACFEEGNFEASFGETFASPTAGSAGADDDDVIFFDC